MSTSLFGCSLLTDLPEAGDGITEENTHVAPPEAPPTDEAAELAETGESCSVNEECATGICEVGDVCGDGYWGFALGDNDTSAHWAIYDSVVDGEGNVIVIGAAPEPHGGESPFVAKYGPYGHELWSHRFETSEASPGHAPDTFGVAVNASGRIVIAGSFAGALSLEGNTLMTSNGQRDIFVIKLDPQGQIAWSRGFGDANDDHAHRVAFDSVSNVVIVGRFEDNLVIDAASATALADGADAFVAKLDVDGNGLWVAHFPGDSELQELRDVAVVGTSIYAVGDYKGQIYLDGFTLPKVVGRTQGWGVALNRDGVVDETLYLASAESTHLSAIDATPGRIVVGGNAAPGAFAVTNGLDSSAGATLTETCVSTGTNCMVIASFTTGDLVPEWSAIYNDTDMSTATALEIDQHGHVVVAAAVRGSALVAGGSNLGTAEVMNVVLAAFDEAGQHKSSKLYPAAGLHFPTSLALDDGDVLVAGYFDGPLGLVGPNPPTSEDGRDAFLARVPSP